MTTASDIFVYEARAGKPAAQVEQVEQAGDGYQPGAPPTKDTEFTFRRDKGHARTNVKWRVKHHSPSGFEFGYEGSGPSDLALNVLEEVLLGLGHKGPRMDCWAGTCFEAAWLAHWDFRRAFIANLPREGGVIERKVVEDWLLGWLINYGAKQGHDN